MALFTPRPDKRMTERDLQTLELFALREIVSPAIVAIIAECKFNRSWDCLKKLETLHMIKKYDTSDLSVFGVRLAFYQLTEHGYFNYHNDYVEKDIRPKMPSSLLHKLHIDYVCAWFIRMGYKPESIDKKQVRKIIGKGRVPDLLFACNRRKMRFAIEIEESTKTTRRYRQIIRQYVALLESGTLQYILYILPTARSAEFLKKRMMREIKEVVLPDLRAAKMTPSMWRKFYFLDVKTFPAVLFPNEITKTDKQHIEALAQALEEDK